MRERAEALAEFTARYQDMRMEGGKMFDEVFTSESMGSYNVTAFLKIMGNRVHQLARMVRVTPNIVAANNAADVSMERVHSMPTELPFQRPPIVFEMEEGSYVTVDGNHRLRKLLLGKPETVPMILVPKEISRLFRVKIECQRRADGVWEEVDIGEYLSVCWGEFGHHKLRDAQHQATGL